MSAVVRLMHCFFFAAGKGGKRKVGRAKQRQNRSRKLPLSAAKDPPMISFENRVKFSNSRNYFGPISTIS